MTQTGRIGLVVIGALAATGAGCSPPLRLKQTGNAITVDVQTFGEYQTSVSRMRLSDRRDGKVIWEIVPVSLTPQINTVKLFVGENSTVVQGTPGGRDYRVVTPQGRGSFRLEAGVPYMIEIWGEHTWLGPTRATFQLAGPKGI